MADDPNLARVIYSLKEDFGVLQEMGTLDIIRRRRRRGDGGRGKCHRWAGWGGARGGRERLTAGKVILGGDDLAAPPLSGLCGRGDRVGPEGEDGEQESGVSSGDERPAKFAVVLQLLRRRRRVPSSCRRRRRCGARAGVVRRPAGDPVEAHCASGCHGLPRGGETEMAGIGVGTKNHTASSAPIQKTSWATGPI